MRNLKLSLVTGALAIAALTPTALASTTGVQSFVETNHGWVSYHSAASLKSPIVGKLLLGDKAPLVSKANAYWYEIKWNGQDVYITTNRNYTHVVTGSTSGTSSSTTSGTSSGAASTGVTTSAAAASTSSSPSISLTTTTYVETNHGWVSYHSAASLSSPVVGKLLLGDKAPLVSKTNAYWYEIKWNGQNVYITTNSTYTHLITETSSGTSPTQSSQPAGSAPTSASPSSSSTATAEPSWQVEADKLISTAKTQLNVPYLWGKQEPGIGFDCSNFTAWTFRTALGISFSGSSVTQRNSVGTPVALSDIREGDLLFFATKNNATGSGHVGIYMGNGMVIQEGGGWGKVTIEPLQGTWLGKNLVFARRVIQ